MSLYYRLTLHYSVDSHWHTKLGFLFQRVFIRIIDCVSVKANKWNQMVVVDVNIVHTGEKCQREMPFVVMKLSIQTGISN